MKATPLRRATVSRDRRESIRRDALSLVVAQLVAYDRIDHNVDDWQLPVKARLVSSAKCTGH